MTEVREKGPCQAKDLELPGISFKKAKNLPWESTQIRFALNMLVVMGQHIYRTQEVPKIL
ncbi:MAG TPA: hypothetical protein ENG70_00250 [Candidatus Cloacimonetes bacterium]|nr:hypothetical protein [Candidatus Cloacimonadota bacterium]HEX37287.1 hypothetical protein [Candidatus Cloacimonadota bacterium]